MGPPLHVLGVHWAPVLLTPGHPLLIPPNTGSASFVTFHSGNNSNNQKSSSNSYCFQRIYYTPGTVLGILQVISLDPHKKPVFYGHLSFMDEESKLGEV